MAAIQKKWRSWLDKNESRYPVRHQIEEIRTVAGLDVAFIHSKGKEIDYGVACAVLWDISAQQTIEIATIQDAIPCPYIPGFLAFHEGPILARAVRQLKIRPDLLMFDGHGYLHPTRFGEAIHIGLALNIPSIGVAKTPFIGQYSYRSMPRERGNYSPIIADDLSPADPNHDEILGFSMCLAANTKPVFVSRGFRTTLDFSKDIALKASINQRQPNPLIEAHIKANKIKKGI